MQTTLKQQHKGVRLRRHRKPAEAGAKAVIRRRFHINGSASLKAAPTKYLLSFNLFLLLILAQNPWEVWDNYGHRQGNHKYSAQRTNAAEQFTHDSFGSYVTIAKKIQ